MQSCLWVPSTFESVESTDEYVDTEIARNIQYSLRCYQYEDHFRHLIDEKKCALTEHRYGLITAKTVLYRGEDQTIEGTQYRNVEKYLVELSSSNMT